MFFRELGTDIRGVRPVAVGKLRPGAPPQGEFTPFERPFAQCPRGDPGMVGPDRGNGSDDALLEHGFGDLDETGHISPANVVDITVAV